MTEKSTNLWQVWKNVVWVFRLRAALFDLIVITVVFDLRANCYENWSRVSQCGTDPHLFISSSSHLHVCSQHLLLHKGEQVYCILEAWKLKELTHTPSITEICFKFTAHVSRRHL